MLPHERPGSGCRTPMLFLPGNPAKFECCAVGRMQLLTACPQTRSCTGTRSVVPRNTPSKPNKERTTMEADNKTIHRAIVSSQQAWYNSSTMSFVDFLLWERSLEGFSCRLHVTLLVYQQRKRRRRSIATKHLFVVPAIVPTTWVGLSKA